MNTVKLVGLFSLAFASGCGIAADHSERISVSENNALGAETLQVERAMDGGNHVLTLRAFSGNDEEVASVQLTIGEISDLTKWLPGTSSTGSELVTTVADNDARSYTRDTHGFDLHLGSLSGHDAAIVRFLGLAAVSSTLAQEANVIIIKTPTEGTETAYFIDCNTDPYDCDNYQATANNCAPSELNAPPLTIGYQCCTYHSPYLGVHETHFINAAGANVTRSRIFNGHTCRSSNDGLCLGSGCYYGPLGFARPVVTTPPSGQHAYTHRYGTTQVGYSCTSEFLSSPPAPAFSNVTGTATPHGCWDGISYSGESEWDY